jgi:Archaeal/vacuolar-type H+-ATPase subunit I
MAYLASGQTLNPIAILINPIGLIIYIFGNLLALALEGLVVFVQDLRLHLYEMFSKFYLGTGRKYSPVMSYIKISFKKA